MIFRQDRFQRGGDHTPFLNQGFPAVRLTTSPLWERETWVGNVTTYTMPDVSIDDVVIGVKAVDRDGHQSIVPPYLEPVLPAMLTPAGANERTCILPLTCATLTGFPVHKFPSHMRVRILYHDHCFDGLVANLAMNIQESKMIKLVSLNFLSEFQYKRTTNSHDLPY